MRRWLAVLGTLSFLAACGERYDRVPGTDQILVTDDNDDGDSVDMNNVWYARCRILRVRRGRRRSRPRDVQGGRVMLPDTREDFHIFQVFPLFDSERKVIRHVLCEMQQCYDGGGRQFFDPLSRQVIGCCGIYYAWNEVKTLPEWLAAHRDSYHFVSPTTGESENG